MDFEIKPITEAGKRMVALAEEHAADFAMRAGQHDREASFPFENIEALQKSGVMAACVPAELGGMGVVSIHDAALAMSRLARGDAATALAANMHMALCWLIGNQWRALSSAGEAEQAAPLEGLLRQIAAGQVVVFASGSEPGTDFLHQLVTGEHIDGGWRLNGTKIFGTMSPAAQLAWVPFRGDNDAGEPRQLFTLIPVGTPGMQIMNNWNALGMRATASNDVVFKDCVISAEGIVDGGPWGEWNNLWLVGTLVANLGLIGAMLGIAEAARAHILEFVKTQRKAPSGRTLAERRGIQQGVAEMEAGLSGARAAFQRIGLLIDAELPHCIAEEAPFTALHALNCQFQCAKLMVLQCSQRVVDYAMTLSGGAGYLVSSPLSRHYRDVRAGSFMQPFSPNEAYEYIGKVTLGLDPALET